jgi:hypothetical protein
LLLLLLLLLLPCGGSSRLVWGSEVLRCHRCHVQLTMLRCSQCCENAAPRVQAPQILLLLLLLQQQHS